MNLTQYWDAEPVPAEIAALMKTYAERNPGLLYRSFSRDSAENFISEHFSPRQLAAFRLCAVPAMQADYFRYCAVLAGGGFYADADTICTAALSPLLGEAEDGVLFQRENRNVVNGCFAFREPGHPLLATVLEIATVGIERRISESVWITTGPGIFTFLHLLTELNAEERRELDYDAIDPDTTTSIRLCHEIASQRHGDIDRLFEGIRVAPFAELEACCVEADLDYKRTGVHWLHWDKSIFAGNPGPA